METPNSLGMGLDMSQCVIVYADCENLIPRVDPGIERVGMNSSSQVC